MAYSEEDVSLASRLADAEAALLFARVNEARLSEENNRYRERCEILSTQLLEAATPAVPVAMSRPPRAPDTSPPTDHEDRVLNLFLTDGKNLTERKVPGLVGAPKGALEFGTVSASVSGAEFVGFRPLRRRDGTLGESKAVASAQKTNTDRVYDMLNRGNDTTTADGGAQTSGNETETEITQIGHRRSHSSASLASIDSSHGSELDNEDESDTKVKSSLKIYEIMWKDRAFSHGPLRRLAFETNEAGLGFIKKQVKEWSQEAQGFMGGSNPTQGAFGRDLNEEPDEHVSAAEEDIARASLRDTQEATSSKTSVELPLGSQNQPLTFSEPSSIFSTQHARRLQQGLPSRLRLRDWHMAYSSKRDGISLRSLYRAAQKEAKKNFCTESLLFVRDTLGNAFGAFTTEPWRVHNRYYGTGESFVFTIDSDDCETSETTFSVTKHGWSQRNDYFMFGRSDCLAVGGGNGFALWLDEELLRGNSCASETFDNPCLSGNEKDFEVCYVELWTFV